MSILESKNAWRQRTEGPKPWSDRLRTGSKNKYFIVTSDSHFNEPFDIWAKWVDPKFRERVPYIKVDADGTQWLISEGWQPQPVGIARNRTDLLQEAESYEDLQIMAVPADKMESEDVMRSTSARTIEGRLKDRVTEGVDAEIIFPTKGLMSFASPDPELATAMCAASNRWAYDTLKDHFDTTLPMALIAPGNVEAAIKEVQWAADKGFHGVLIPNRPIFHRNDQPRNALEYNNTRVFDPLWSAIEEANLTITMHASTGQDPRAVGGHGGAITNFVLAVSGSIEPLTQIISSGVFVRHPKLRLATVESGVGWLPWLLNQMDFGYRAHHMWVRPMTPDLPSDYYKAHCYSTFVEEPGSVELLTEMGLGKNLLWSNDYPHPEGSFPYSTITIERSLGKLTDAQRADVLGENAARAFNIKRS